MKPKYLKIGNEKVIILDSDRPNCSKMALTKEGKRVYLKDKSLLNNKKIKDLKDVGIKLIKQEEYFDSI